jgi:hypothetical protein
LLSAWTYADLTARLRAKLSSAAANPLFDLVRHRNPNLDESRFVDTVSGCLARGDFDLIVAGDGIRSDMHAIAGFLGVAGGLMARFALVEFQVWRDEAGTCVVLPFVPYRTTVVEQRVLVGTEGRPLTIETSTEEDDDAAAVADPGSKAKLAANRAFWDCLIGSIRFAHPDQPAPRHGGNNWVKVALPEPCALTLYRTGSEVGAFVSFRGTTAEEVLARFELEASSLGAEIKWPIAFVRVRGKTILTAKATTLSGDTKTDDGQLDWLRRIADQIVTAVRTRL